MSERSRALLVMFGSPISCMEDMAVVLRSKLLSVDIESRDLLLNELCDVPGDVSTSRASGIAVVFSNSRSIESHSTADSFWSMIHTNVDPPCHTIYFCVFAFCDTNFEGECHLGKRFDERMQELGGDRIMSLQFGDPIEDNQQMVEKWCADVACSLNEVSTNSCSSFSERSGYGVLLPGTATVSNVCDYLGVQVSSLSIPPDAAVLLKSRKTSVGVIDILSDDDISVVDGFHVRENGEYCLSNPFKASIMGANWLTHHSDFDDNCDQKWGEQHEVIRMELNICGSGIHYQPGDYISIVAPNPSSHVELIIERLQRGLKNMKSSSSTSHQFTSLSPETKIRRNGQVMSLQELFQFRLDLVAPPRKPCIFSFSDYCLDESEANIMKWMCSKGELGKKLWANFVEIQTLTVAEVLALFPSCCPPLHVLVSLLPPLTPRAYSVASSPLAHPHSVVIAFSIVKFCSGLFTQRTCVESSDVLHDVSKYYIRRSGLCTTYLKNLLQPFLQSNGGSTTRSESISLRVLWKQSNSFRLPGNVASPLVMIGPGTGVAPFIGFLEHREVHDRERSQSGEDATTGLWRGGFELDEACKLPHEGNVIDNFIQCVDPGRMFLFYGCRDENDWIFKEAMLQFKDDGTLFSLDVAFSRKSAEKVYVSHKLLAKGSELAHLILNCNAHIYICGDGNQMAKDVMKALSDILHIHGDLSMDDAHEFINDMKSRRRLLLDVWS